MDNYAQLPWGYVVSAVNRGLKIYHQRLHDQERPIALLSSMQANQNRDKKKQPKAYTYLDFSFYKPQHDGETPDGHNGAAYLELIRLKLLPSWALFCFKEIAAAAAPGYVPGEPGLIAEDAVLLHPEARPDGYVGLLIAAESASDQLRTFTSTKGVEITLRVPYVDSKFIARENELLTR